MKVLIEQATRPWLMIEEDVDVTLLSNYMESHGRVLSGRNTGSFVTETGHQWEDRVVHIEGYTELAITHTLTPEDFGSILELLGIEYIYVETAYFDKAFK